MTQHVLQIVESRACDAGSVFISISGLANQLSSNGIQSSVLSGGEQTIDERELLRAIETADVVHIHGWDHPTAHAAAAFAKAKGIAYVVSPLGGLSVADRASLGWVKRLRMKRLDNRLLRDCKRLLAINNCELSECRRSLPSVLSEVLPYGLDISEYEQGHRAEASPPDSDGHTILILAPIHPREGSVAFLKCLAELGRLADDWSVTLAGREIGEYRKMLEAALRRKGAVSRVSFISANDEVTQRKYLARANLLVCPALRARCPVSMLQGLATGTPTLATQAVAPNGAVDALQSCAPTPLGLREATAAILALAEADRRGLGMKAQAWFRVSLDWRTLAPRYIKLYEELGSV